MQSAWHKISKLHSSIFQQYDTTVLWISRWNIYLAFQQFLVNFKWNRHIVYGVKLGWGLDRLWLEFQHVTTFYLTQNVQSLSCATQCSVPLVLVQRDKRLRRNPDHHFLFIAEVHPPLYRGTFTFVTVTNNIYTCICLLCIELLDILLIWLLIFHK